MTQNLFAATLVVPDYDAGIAFYVDTLGFDLVEDTALSDTKRWVLIAPKGAQTCLLLALAATPEQRAAIGRQAGGRVAFFLQTDDFAGDHARMVAAGVHFEEQPRTEPYGIVAVWCDPFGNRWDLVQFTKTPTRGVPPAKSRSNRETGTPVIWPPHDKARSDS
ncbi:VOC family protein [Pseudooceanicola sediminis]|uniref:VOC family protein n=1 Tax=Pseudooceanicola sediminis TaxID=2211117 RepID=A0A399J880_9RHOB|nr:VOC family protein [Pseudooceanicola sediminis]KAA2316796.1 VOC family protein [Puniceibacterium sp. HSS470]RII40747.1 VOC family protein [Pseudooceanicola sediminis]|tara:strand:+ start:223677 stop:224165 length:489 start_codon:yes stop_codon:yes gene_type:complete